MVSVLVCLLLSGCAAVPAAGLPPVTGRTDACGYTWARTGEPAPVIHLAHEPDWTKYPGGCRVPQIRGCTDRTPAMAVILTRQPLAEMLAEPGECNTVFHELRHALGFTHAEAHSYTPRDYTR